MQGGSVAGVKISFLRVLILIQDGSVAGVIISFLRVLILTVNIGCPKETEPYPKTLNLLPVQFSIRL